MLALRFRALLLVAQEPLRGGRPTFRIGSNNGRARRAIRTRAVLALRLPSLTGDMSPSYSWNGRRTFERARECREFIYPRLNLIHGGGQPVTCRERCSRPNKHERCGGQHLLKPVAIRRNLHAVCCRSRAALNTLIISRLNVGMSLGLRPVTRLRSTTTS